MRYLLRSIVTLACLLVVFFSLQTAFEVNRHWNFSRGVINPTSFEALQYIKNRDSELYYVNIGVPDALRFATDAEKLMSGVPLTVDYVTSLRAWHDSPNRIVGQGSLADGQQLVVLVSDYPGWQVTVDGVAAPLQAVNGYLRVKALSGNHTFSFIFYPLSYEIGLAVSIISVLVSPLGCVANVHVARLFL